MFELLRPSYRWRENYKTNNAFKIGRRVILSFMVSPGYDKPFRVHYQKDQHIIAMEGVFSLLDGKGPVRERRQALAEAINTCNGKGETTYFRFKCFRNGNLHLEFKRLDLVKQLNGLAVGSFELGRDEEQVS